MGKNTSVSLGEHFEEFVQYRIKEGRYKNASEVIRAGLRLLEEEEEQKFYALKSAIEEGIDSGIAVDFEPNDFLESVLSHCIQLPSSTGRFRITTHLNRDNDQVNVFTLQLCTSPPITYGTLLAVVLVNNRFII